MDAAIAVTHQTIILFAWVFLELIFLAISWLYLSPRMNRLEPPAKYSIDGKRLMLKVLDMVEWLSQHDDISIDFTTFFEGWFLGTPSSELKRQNVVVFLAWTMYAKEVAVLSKGERNNVIDMVNVVEKRLGRILEPGHNPDAICMRHTLDPVVPFTHRPLALYALFGLSRLAVRCLLSVWGFRRRVSPCGTFCYWYREAIVAPGNGDANGARGGCITGRDPIVFFHGLGFGLASYALAVWKVCHGRTSIVVESPSITMSLHLLRGHTPPSETQLAESVESIMKRHGIKRATFFGHSFGSVAVAWMARLRPKLVSQIALLDPVCLLLFLPEISRLFFSPDRSGMTLHEKLMRYLVSEEKGISHTLRRHFWWYANVLWPEDIQCPLVVGLSGQDKIVPVKPIRRFLLSHPSMTTTAPSGGQGRGIDHVRNDPSSIHGCSRNKCTNSDCHRGSDDGSSEPIVSNKGGPPADEVCGRTGSSTYFAEDGGVFPQVDKRKKYGTSRDVGSPKEVELLYWPNHGHAWVLGDPTALSEFMAVAARQEQAFAVNSTS